MNVRLLVMAATLFASLSLSGPGHANDEDGECQNPSTQVQMNECAAIEAHTADVELSVAFNRARDHLAVIEENTPKEWKGVQAALLSAQRAWITYRDEHCRAQGLRFGGGSILPLIVNACLAQLTRERTRQLKELAEEG
ncbi:MAG: lysozyme inhibitor LprI family protein [Pseudomonadota bacterium]